MTDRPVRLNLDLPRMGGEPAGSQNGGGQPGAARDDDVARFRQALGRDGQQPAAEGGTGQGGERPQEEEKSSPFGLFGRLSGGAQERADAAAAGLPGFPSPFLPGTSAAGAAEPAAPAAPLPRAAAEVVGAVAERILVSADGGQEIRVLIRNEVLPGVEVRIVQEQGRWVMDFAVGNAGSLALLQGAGARLAAELSRRLRREVEVRVGDPQRADEEGEAQVFVEDRSGEATPLAGLPSITLADEGSREE
ncbi:hypothetical protein [Pseudothauera rhizosphaerae]|uniref:Uncharacterized protein n=1 Tax=Pseudothauera rhizosphaerae TaxID=2565932 RepID=A0A4S4AEQ4_9RHOO|nr:hypothetical protein [Pseudothauera rhizosphaerae]THF57266.1 hypothetical protein E6O51_18390 [Pseudothauera rhizosphaerae]